ncbi:fatty acid desaturase family protein [Anatilimnocola floriformis]|uniref:fatty acid desaturase family protein n=1 Tax=Anatilimnocola floriformis TaxID=2948575 RepID=UPI0020C2DCFC|nr:fatty acid desaturase [Anatilimnocola floriformis]
MLTAEQEVDETLAELPHEQFSLAAARHIVRDLYTHRPAIYWADFLATLFSGMVCFGLVRRWDELLPMISATAVPAWLSITARVFFFACACLFNFRAVNFIHEVVHLPARKFWLFNATWNLLCGIPFLTPSFTHEGHLDHHRRRIFGTTADGEYLALGRLSRWWIAVYLSQALWAPPLAILRFGVLTPLSWLSPRIRDWVHARFSSLVMDPRYQRPLPSPTKLRAIRWQEGLCFAWIVGVVVIGSQLGWSRLISFVAQAYLMGVVIILLNCLRTLGAHRFRGAGDESTFVEQLLDSVNIDSRWPWDMAVAPVGLRYHATHHLFPAIPYHNLPEAHRRLQAELPADSLYHQTREPSLLAALRKLFHRV